MLRKLYYKLPPALRFAARWLYYLPADLAYPPPPMVPPRRLIYTGRGDFVKQGDAWLAFFKEQGLQPQHNFLDIGSGIGRIARALTTFLTGTYHGFDAVKTGVVWCQKHISRRHPNFHFTHVPLYNDLYRASGLSAAEYRFPFTDEMFDFACAISVFTHLLPEESENYLKETARILKPNGKLVATFFLLTGAPSEHTGAFSFAHHRGYYALMDANVQHANVAYDYIYLLSVSKSMGLRLNTHISGSWRDDVVRDPLAFQDILVWEKMG
jgi:ubiquinone/menaquinone biosynthesis C-methylase UbiE